MTLEIKNIGRFHESQKIDINGITILAGENGTGKSTIGKALYCVYNSLYEYRQNIERERKNSIVRMLRHFSNKDFSPNSTYYRNRINKIFERYQYDYSNTGLVEDLVNSIKEEGYVPDDIKERIEKVMSTPEDDIIDAMINRRINAEFDMQVGHVNYTEENSSITVTVKGETIQIDIDSEGRAHATKKIELLKDLVYLDDPNILSQYERPFLVSSYSHSDDVLRKITRRKESTLSVVDDVIVEEKLKSVYSKLDSVCGADIKENDEEEGELLYYEKSLKRGINISNISTGVKSFLILKRLLYKGYLEENGMVVLDEPEVHLHPEWMMVYGEVVVLLHKILGINFVISTHSSEFISYIELFSKKHEIHLDSCKYYILERDNKDESTSIIKDCTSNVDEIYERLTRSFIYASKELDSI